ncbi:MAG: SPOR domain-containing protein [Deltaproteobacteria bacterium]|nr:MAG: SPOR domain-containing protein [Deltaproteobacteria bacterium]
MNSRKALLIENDESYIKLISGALIKLGFKSMVLRGGGGRAPELVKQELPNLIILALELPGVNGYIICKRIKETEETKGIPLILISSQAKPEDFEKHRKLRIRADEYLIKPFNQEDLLKKIKTIIDTGKQLEEEAKILSERRADSEDQVMVKSSELASFKQLLEKLKHQNKVTIDKLRSDLREKTESEERLAKILAAERKGFQQEKARLEAKLLKEIEGLKDERNRLKGNISELEAVPRKGEQSEEIKKNLDQALGEMDGLKRQYQDAVEEKSSLSEDLKKAREEKERLKANISELEVALRKGEQSDALEQAFAERDKLREQYQTTLKENSRLIEDLKRELEEKGSLISKNKELQGEIEDLRGRLRTREEKAVETEEPPEELDELEVMPETKEEKELEKEIPEAEEAVTEAASTETPKIGREAPEAVPIGRLELEKVVSVVTPTKGPEAEEAVSEAVPIARMGTGEKAKRIPLSMGIIGGGAALLVILLTALYFFTDIFSSSRSTSEQTSEPASLASVALTGKKTTEEAITEPKEEEQEEEAIEVDEEKEEATIVEKEEIRTAKKEASPRKPEKKTTAKAAKKEVPRYTVQVGTYKNKANLEKVKRSIKGLGFEPYTVEERRKGKEKAYYVYLDKKFILGEANSVSMKLNIFEIKHKKIKQKGGKYSIFAGKFSKSKDAQAVKQKIKDAGYPATVTTRSSTELFYVCQAGRFTTRGEANRAANTLKSKGYKPEIVEIKK